MFGYAFGANMLDMARRLPLSSPSFLRTRPRCLTFAIVRTSAHTQTNIRCKSSFYRFWGERVNAVHPEGSISGNVLNTTANAMPRPRLTS